MLAKTRRKLNMGTRVMEFSVATGRKRELRRLMLQAHLDHLANVAEIASIEEPEVLSGLQLALDQFETAAEQGAAGRLAHVGASAELVVVSEQVVQVVKVMNGLIRLRFGNQPEILAAWESASNVTATPRPPETRPSDAGNPVPGGQERPAA